jgi:uncharacterized protein YcsI (UPF0317 family)
MLANPASASGAEIRALCRSGVFDRPTTGVALGYVQANLVILRRKWSEDFHEFCRLNPQPCPILDITKPGVYEPQLVAPSADLRHDLPRYRVLQNGVCVGTPASIESYWDGDCIAFLIGCSFTFENLLLEADLPVRHIEQNRNVPMYRTNIACRPVGPFAPQLVVSMRPMTPSQAHEACKITAMFPRAHGQPVHVGDPAALGIKDLTSPDYGDAVSIHDDEIPVFWACGVTPLEAIMQAKPDFAITHEPGHMFVTDIRDQDLRDLAP